MRTLGLAALVVLVASSAPAQTLERVHLKGAYAQIIVPEPWNGGLFIYAHGYSADAARSSAGSGYAWIT